LLVRWPGIGLDRYALACAAVLLGSLAVNVYQTWRYLQELTGR
jgi:hypothetical protein